MGDKGMIDRRSLIAAALVLPPAQALARLSGSGGAAPGPVAPNQAHNPDQLWIEERALAIWKDPSVQRAKDALAPLFLDSPPGKLPAGMSDWRDALDEMAFGYIQRTIVYSDAANPRVLVDQSPPHAWYGVAVPGSRMTGNNPDNVYRRIPIDDSLSYELRGRRIMPGPSDVSVEVLPVLSEQLNWEKTGYPVFDFEQLETERDGSFVITIDTLPANGRRNHFQLRPGAVRLTIRDTMADWARENPGALQMVRVGGAARPSPTIAALTEKVIGGLHGFAAYWLDFNTKIFFGRPVNSFVPPVRGVEPRGLKTKLTTFGNYSLAEDEALVVTADRLGAGYFALALQNCWLQTAEHRSRTGSLNNAQAIPGADGRYTYVISKHDPGVHNWGDTNGFLQGEMQFRWQDLPAGTPDDDAANVRTRKVKLAELDAALPADMVRVTPAERRAQQSQRAAAYDRRYPGAA